MYSVCGKCESITSTCTIVDHIYMYHVFCEVKTLVANGCRFLKIKSLYWVSILLEFIVCVQEGKLQIVN